MRVKLNIYILSIVVIVLLCILRCIYVKVYEGFVEGNIYVFYHIYCNNNTLEVLKEQVATIIESGLERRSNAIYCFLTGDAQYIEAVKSYIGTLPGKFIVKSVGVGDTSYERFTLNKITGIIQDSDKFLYMHTKGVSTADKSKKNNILLWRKYMEYALIERYQDCLNALDTYDIVGVAYATRIIGPHFSGNFWWSRGSYYIELQKSVKIGEGYWDPESYIFKNNPKYYVIDKTVPIDADLYNMPVRPELYRGK